VLIPYPGIGPKLATTSSPDGLKKFWAAMPGDTARMQSDPGMEKTSERIALNFGESLKLKGTLEPCPSGAPPRKRRGCSTCRPPALLNLRVFEPIGKRRWWKGPGPAGNLQLRL